MTPETYEISGYGMKATVMTRGAQLTSWQDDAGQEHIWNGDPAVWANQTPPLFPVCGNVRGLTIGGEPSGLTRHGFSKDSFFTVTAHNESDIVLTLTDNEHTRKVYPFAFRFSIGWYLMSTGILCGYTVENTNTKPLPFCVGGHAGFTCPMEEGASFDDYDIVFAEPEDGIVYDLASEGLLSGTEETVDLKDGRALALSHALFDEKDTLIFKGLRSRSVKLVNRKTNHGLELDFTGFPALALWTMPNKAGNYICIEPWLGLPQTEGGSCAMEDKPYLKTLNPGEKFELFQKVTLF